MKPEIKVPPPNNKKNIQNEFECIYKKYFSPLCNYVKRYIYDEDSAREVVQETMIKFWKKIENGETVESPEKYLYRSVYNASLNKLEHIKVHNKYVSKANIRLKEIELENFEDTFYQWEIQENLEKEIKKLTPKCKEVFEMRYLECLCFKEIAEKLKISERTVESHVQSAIKKLRKRLKHFL